MAKNLKIAIFGNDMFTYKVFTSLFEGLEKAQLNHEYFPILPSIDTTVPKDAPPKLFAQFIKENERIWKPKTLKTNWKLVTSYLKDLRPNYGLVCDATRIDPNLRLVFDKQMFLVHPSILPKFAGPDPIPNTLSEGVKQTGITITDIDPESNIYENDIIHQEEVNVDENDSYLTLAEKLGLIAGRELTTIIKDLEGGSDYERVKLQAPPKPSKKLSRIFSIDETEAKDVVKLFRVLKGDNYPPATFMRINNELVLSTFIDPELCKDELIPKIKDLPTGTMSWNFESDIEGLYIKCRQETIRCRGIRIMQAGKQSRGAGPRYFINTYILSKEDKDKVKEGEKLLFNTGSNVTGFSSYKNTVDKKFQYILNI